MQIFGALTAIADCIRSAMASPNNYNLYKLFLHLLLLALVVGQAVEESAGECNSCSVSSNQACVADNQFKACQNGEPTGEIITCAAGQKCSIYGTCQPEASVTTPPCASCNVCSASKTFACTGTQTFALCLGTNKTSEITGTCLDDLICNIYNPNICGKVEDGFVATCSYADDPTTVAPTTTPSPSKNPEEFCTVMAENSRFPVGSDLDTTCKQYIRCVQNGERWIGALYYCPGGTYFDSTSRACGKSIPPRCKGTVGTLNLRSLSLF